MQQYFHLFARILMMRAPPQALPASPALFWITFSLLFLLTLGKGALVYPALKNLVFNVVDLGLLLGFLYALLALFRRQGRFLQAATAVCGVYVLFYLLDFPAYWLVVSEALPPAHAVFNLAMIFIYLLMFYSVMVLGHILRHALDSTLVTGVLIALAYYVANIFLMVSLFPRQGA